MFNIYHQPYARGRYPVVAANGIVATGNNLAAAAGLQIMREGGNAIDAAIATAATLTVVEPTANGIGSDAFAIVWHKAVSYTHLLVYCFSYRNMKTLYHVKAISVSIN